MSSIGRIKQILFSRTDPLPTWQADHEASLRYDPDTDRLQLGGTAKWNNVFMAGDKLSDKIAGTPTFTVDHAKVGTTAAATFGTDSSDMSGVVTITSGGTGYAAGVIGTFNFVDALPNVNFTVLLSAGTSDSARLAPYYITSRTVNGFGIATRNLPATGETYAIYYFIIHREAP